MDLITGFSVWRVGAENPITARSTETTGAPLILSIRDGAALAEITIYTQDQSYTDALIEAINRVNAAREADKVIADLASESEAA